MVQRYDDTCASGATPALREAALQQVRAATPADRTRVARRSAGPLRRSGRRGARGGAAGSGGGHRLPAHADRAGQDARPRLFVLRARQLLSEPPSARPPLPLSSDQRAARRDCAGLRASGRGEATAKAPAQVRPVALGRAAAGRGPRARRARVLRPAAVSGRQRFAGHRAMRAGCLVAFQ